MNTKTRSGGKKEIKQKKLKVQNDLDENLLQEGVKSLLAYEAKKSIQDNASNLLENYAKPIFVQIQLKKTLNNKIIRPVRIAIPNTLYDPTVNGQEHTICLFCRSPDKTLLLEEVEKKSFPGLLKIISLDEIKKSYKQFQDRKKLLKEFSHFVCDNRIFSHVINLLGKVFTSRNNHPIPIEMSNMNKLHTSLDKSVNQATYMHPSGTLLSIRFGMTNMSSRKIIQNITEGLKIVFDKLGFGLGSINSIHLKSSDSPALPIHYSHQNEIIDFLKKKITKKEVSTPVTTAPAGSAPAAVGAVKKGKKSSKTTLTEEIDAPLSSRSSRSEPEESSASIETIKPFSKTTVANPPIKKGNKGSKTTPLETPSSTSSLASSSLSSSTTGKKIKKNTPVEQITSSQSEPVAVVEKKRGSSQSDKVVNKKKKSPTSTPIPVSVPVPAPVPTPVSEPVTGKKRSKEVANATSSSSVVVEASNSLLEKPKKSKLRKLSTTKA